MRYISYKLYNYKIVEKLVLKSEASILKKKYHIPNSYKWFQFYEYQPGCFWIEFKNHFVFHVLQKKKQVLILLQNKKSKPSLVHYMNTQLKSFLLCLEGAEALHGTVLKKNQTSFVFLGDSGTGKSTLAAYMMTMNWDLLSDDMVEFQSNFSRLKLPTMAYLKLYPSVSKKFHLKGKKLGPLNQHTKKELWQFKVKEKNVSPKGFVLLAPSKSNRFQITQLTGLKAFQTLIQSTFNISYLNTERNQSCFKSISQLSKSYPVFKLTYPKRYSSLPKLLELIESISEPRPRPHSHLTHNVKQ